MSVHGGAIDSFRDVDTGYLRSDQRPGVSSPARIFAFGPSAIGVWFRTLKDVLGSESPRTALGSTNGGAPYYTSALGVRG